MEPTRSIIVVGFIKKGGRPTALSYDLLTQAELCNDCTIAVDVLLGEVVEKASALADHHQKAAAGMVVLLVLTQMLGQGVDPGSEDSDLNLGRTGITGMGRVLLDNGSFFFFAHHSCVSTFQNIPGVQVSGRQKTRVKAGGVPKLGNGSQRMALLVKNIIQAQKSKAENACIF